MDSQTIIKKYVGKRPKALDSFDEWAIKECVAIHYLIANLKAQTARCTYCGRKVRLPKEARHQYKTSCPQCGKEAIVLEERYGRKKYNYYFRAITYAAKNKKLWMAVWICEVSFKEVSVKSGRPTVGKQLSNLYVLDAEEQHRFDSSWGYWTERKKMKIPPAPVSMNGWTKYGFIYGKTDNLEQVLKKTDAKYLYDALMLYMSPDQLLGYISLALRYHSAEILFKAGFTEIIRTKIEKGMKKYWSPYQPSKAINWRADSLTKIMKLPMRDIRRLRDINPTLAELYVYQHLKIEEARLMPMNILREISRLYSRTGEIPPPECFVEDMDPKWYLRFLKYIDTQGWLEEDPEQAEWFSIYADYTKMMKELGEDITKNKVRFPEDLIAAHDEAVEKLKIVRNKTRDERIRKNARLCDYTEGDYMVIAADSQAALNKESAILHHCVKTYGDKIARGECWIFFIRQKDDPKTPFYTLECNTAGQTIQCKGNHNCSMTDDVKEFVNGFTAHLASEIQKERKQQCQTA